MPQDPKPYDPVEERDILQLLEMLDDDRVREKIAAFLFAAPPSSHVGAMLKSQESEEPSDGQ